MSYYAITATITSVEDRWTNVRQVPTFYLDENVQGIVDEEHAMDIATDILTAGGSLDVQVYVCAVKV